MKRARAFKVFLPGRKVSGDFDNFFIDNQLALRTFVKEERAWFFFVLGPRRNDKVETKRKRGRKREWKGSRVSRISLKIPSFASLKVCPREEYSIFYRRILYDRGLTTRATNFALHTIKVARDIRTYPGKTEGSSDSRPVVINSTIKLLCLVSLALNRTCVPNSKVG